MYYRLFSVISRKMSSTTGSRTNRLALEKSPYLLQHASNPVDWYPWGSEAFTKARNENKPIFLSVGYSTCHWCHVMEKESFENEDVAAIMNRYFINIKVDREERPDVDKIYMSFITTISDGGGWPMSVFLTPNLEPITGGTYFPPEDKWGRPGFKTILNKIAEQWQSEHSSVSELGTRIIDILKHSTEKFSKHSSDVPPPLTKCIQNTIGQFKNSFQHEFGGFSRAPKFPQASNFEFLFNYYRHQSKGVGTQLSQDALNMCLRTLKFMAKGGIYDHVGNGFSRYSTDSKWHVPHFEKMLYDQGQLVISYCNAWLTTKDPFFSDTVRNILTYVSRDMSHASGGFYSAEDADSYPYEGATHKKEGAFYLWEYSELCKVLTGVTNNVSDLEIFNYHFDVKPNGNVTFDPHKEFRNKNILILFGSVEDTAQHFELSVAKIKESLDKSLKILFEVREKRPRPHLDSKMLTSWNALMISAYAKAGEILDEPDYIKRAVDAAKCIKTNLYNESTNVLYRCCYAESDQVSQISTPIIGFLDDYAYLIRALIDLYEATFDASWLEWAEKLQTGQDQMFWDEINFGYFTCSDTDPSILIRMKDDHDGAEPSGNSVSALNLLRLSEYLDVSDMKDRAGKLLCSYSERLEKVGISLPLMLVALMWFHEHPSQIFIVGDRNDPATKAFIKTVRQRLMTGRIIVLADNPEGSSAMLYQRLDILSKLKNQGNSPTVYMCQHQTCSLPITKIKDFEQILDENK